MDAIQNFVQRLLMWCVALAREIVYYHLIPELMDKYIYSHIKQWLAPDQVLDSEALPGQALPGDADPDVGPSSRNVTQDDANPVIIV